MNECIVGYIYINVHLNVCVFVCMHVPGVRKLRSPTIRWIDDMEKWAKMLFETLLRKTEDRWRWRRLVHEATNLRMEDG